jgi:acyl-CoA thioesterase I
MEMGIWGDSITYGAGDREALGWAGRLRKAIENSRNDAEIYNFGVCGDTTEGLLKRFAVEAASIEPQVVLFAIGTNDVRCHAGEVESEVPLKQYQRNIEELVTLAKKHTQKICLVGLTQINEVHEKNVDPVYRNAALATYNEFLRDYAARTGLTFINLWDVTDVAIDLDDGLHPNAQGYQKMFERIYPVIQSLL